MRKPLLSLLLACAILRTAQSAELTVTVEVPRLDVAEYHRPYVAIWIERADQSAAGDLAVWYDVAMKNNEGAQWLKDMRQWWRRSGRNQTFPVDGVSGATRPVGKHSLRFSDKQGALASLEPGQYAVVVEAAREVGGREMLRLPFSWPPQGPAQDSTRGQHELGEFALQIKP